MKLILIYRVDKWHSNESKQLVGISENMDECNKMIDSFIEKHQMPELTENEILQIEFCNQTQGYSCPNSEFVIEHIKLNQIIS